VTRLIGKRAVNPDADESRVGNSMCWTGLSLEHNIPIVNRNLISRVPNQEISGDKRRGAQIAHKIINQMVNVEVNSVGDLLHL
jgi:hypothetical protein